MIKHQLLLVLITLTVGICSTSITTAQPTNQPGTPNPELGTNSAKPQTLSPEPRTISSKDLETEFKNITHADDLAQADADRWTREFNSGPQSATNTAALQERIQKRFAPVKQAYEKFIKDHPGHINARLVYGSFLHDHGEEAAALKEWEKARELDPKNAAAWNNLANHYAHDGPIGKAFDYYAQATKLDPTEPLYLHNYAITLSTYRKEAMAHYHIDEQQVYRNALAAYQKALLLSPLNFQIAQDLAQTYYGIRPVQTDRALAAWTNALNLAPTDYERQEIQLHLARFKLNADRFDDARSHLLSVTNADLQQLKSNLLHNIQSRQTNSTNNSALNK